MPIDVDAVVWVADGEAYGGLDYGVQVEQLLARRGLRVSRRYHDDANWIDSSVKLHVLTGGATSVNDTSGWMPEALVRTGELLKRAQQGRCLVYGICLGAQMISEALFPGSVRGGNKIEVGLTTVRWADDETLPTVVPAFHYEEVNADSLRAGGGVVLARNDHSAVQAFKFGDAIYGTQFHPELSPNHVRSLIQHHQSTVMAYGGNSLKALATVDRLENAWKEAVFDRILDRIVARNL
jgi:GMP synthase-like glutamine amidotransferase